jgi:hypothetical protein
MTRDIDIVVRRADLQRIAEAVDMPRFYLPALGKPIVGQNTLGFTTMRPAFSGTVDVRSIHTPD